jgi:hypothetical protein
MCSTAELIKIASGNVFANTVNFIHYEMKSLTLSSQVGHQSLVTRMKA